MFTVGQQLVPYISRVIIHTSLLLLMVPVVSIAQEREPIGRFVIDIHGSLPLYGQNAELAANEKLLPLQLPSRGLGLSAGAHLHLLRLGLITFGVGANLLTSSGERSAAKDDPLENGPTVKARFTAISPQLSFNFGTKEGWSYLSGGLGTSKLSIAKIPDSSELKQRSTRTLNYGGGARWFIREHLAFSVDLRFYAISPLAATNPKEAARPRMTLVVFNAGLSFR